MAVTFIGAIFVGRKLRKRSCALNPKPRLCGDGSETRLELESKFLKGAYKGTIIGVDGVY